MRAARSALITLVGALALSAAPSEAATVPTLPDGATIAGVQVGGLGPFGARQALHQALDSFWLRPIVLQVGRRKERISPTSAGFRIRYRLMVHQAFVLAAHGQPVQVRISKSISSRRLSAAVRRLGRPFYRAPRNARVRLGVKRIVRIHGRNGRGLNSSNVRRKLKQEMRRPTQDRLIRAALHTIHPAITVRKLRRIYGTYISIDRRHFKLRLFKRLRHVATYGIAVGMAGLETPAGLRHVLGIQRNPAWHVPNRSWAGALAGQTIPPGDPRNPLRVAFIDLGGGIGIHGTSEDWSIGTRASHGCIRMHARDIARLYPRVPVGTPVLVR